LNIERLNSIEESGIKTARGEDWLLVADRGNAQAEWESLNLLFRYLVADPAVLTSTELALFANQLERALVDAQTMGPNLGLGDHNSLKAACRLCAQRCLAVCESQNMKPDDLPGVKAAHDAVEVLLKYLEEQANKPLPVKNGNMTEVPGTAPLSACLFPRWQLAADHGDIPDELTGGSAAHPEMEQLDKLEKAQDIFVNLKVPKVKFTDQMKAPVADVLKIISKVIIFDHVPY